MHSVILIPARLRSTRLHEKLLQRLDDKTVLEHVVSRCLQSNLASDVVLVCDHDLLAKTVESTGVRIIQRNKVFLNGTERIADVLREMTEVDLVINVQGDEVFIDPELIDQMIEELCNNPELQICSARSAKRFNSSAPQDVKVSIDKKGFALSFQREFYTGPGTSFKHIGVYGFRRSTLLDLIRLEPTQSELTHQLEQLRWLDNGYPIKMIPANFDSISIDTLEDLIKARLHLRSQQEYDGS